MSPSIWLRHIQRRLLPSRRAAARQRRKQKFALPRLEALEDRVTPTGSITVTNFTDNGGGTTLRDAVTQADANSSGVFTINLVGGTYTLSQTAPLSLSNAIAGTTIVIHGSTDPNNPTVINETGKSRVLQVTSGTNVIIDNVTVEHGKAEDAPGGILQNLTAAGGGLLNNGGNVALTNDVFQSNSALAFKFASGGASGGAAGGGIFSFNGILTLDTVTLFKNNAAGGVTDGNPGGFAVGGGLAEINSTVNVTNVPAAPGAVSVPLPVPFDTSTLPAFSPLLTIAQNNAFGGRGAAGTNVNNNGGAGGNAAGGGMFASGGAVSIVAASFTENLAEGGIGNEGFSSDNLLEIGNGGAGGGAGGGGLDFVLPAGSTPPIVQASSFLGNQAVGGNAGKGGDDDSTVFGTPFVGNGGNGGSAAGGGVSVLGANVGLQMFNSTLVSNSAAGGNGGNGGNNLAPEGPTGGHGGDGGSAGGGGLEIVTGVAASTLTNVTIVLNSIDMLPTGTMGGQPGLGGTSNGGVNGLPGSLGIATGGGINSDGSAALINSAVADNGLLGGNTTNGGPDVGGTVSAATQFSYFGNPNGANLLTDPNLFDATNQVALNNNGYGGFRDALGNLVPTNPMFAQNGTFNGGPTQTVELQAGSYLIGRGTPNANGAALDQRGVPRGTSVDLGAVQLLGFPTTLGLVNVSATSQGVTETVSVSDADATGPAVQVGSVQFQLLNSVGTVVDQQTANVNSLLFGGSVTLGSNLAPGTYTVTASFTDTTGYFQNSAAAPQMVTVPPSSPPGSPPGAPPPSPSGSSPPSLFQAILGLYIAEVEKDIGFGNPQAVQQAIDFNARFTVIFGINIAPLIEQIADSNVANASGGSA
jgi:hypothetical protein